MTPKHCLDSLSVPSIHRGTLILAASLLAGGDRARAADHGARQRGLLGTRETVESTCAVHLRRWPLRVVRQQSQQLGAWATRMASMTSSSATARRGRQTCSASASSGTQGNARSLSPSISGDGRYVAFESDATNLVASGHERVGRRLRARPPDGTTERVSVDSLRRAGERRQSEGPSISADGRFVAFPSFASNLVAGDTNGLEDVFVHDRQTGATERVSVELLGQSGNVDGTFWRTLDLRRRPLRGVR